MDEAGPLSVSLADASSVLTGSSASSSRTSLTSVHQGRILRFLGQLDALCALGYPLAAGMDVDRFKNYFLPLQGLLGRLPELRRADVDFCVVVPFTLVPLYVQMGLLARALIRQERVLGVPATDCPDTPEGHCTVPGDVPIDVFRLELADGVEVPSAPYLAASIMADYDDVVMSDPDDASWTGFQWTLKEQSEHFREKGYSGLTPAEGIALMTHEPMFCSRPLYLLGAVYRGAQVPSLGPNGGTPRLGYCGRNSRHEAWRTPVLKQRLSARDRIVLNEDH